MPVPSSMSSVSVCPSNGVASFMAYQSFGICNACLDLHACDCRRGWRGGARGGGGRGGTRSVRESALKAAPARKFPFCMTWEIEPASV